MPSILLINDNKIVSRLLQLSSQKHNYALEEINDYTPSESAYNVIFIDSDKYDADALEALKSTLTYDKLGFIGDKHVSAPAGFDFSLEKPFLPTDFVSLMSENFRVLPPEQIPNELDDIEEIEGEDELDLDNLEEMDIDLDSIEEVEELEAIGDELLPPETTLTTGIADAMVEDESKEELAGIVDEIENMEVEEDLLEEMDLDALGDEEEELVSEEALVEEESIESSVEDVVKESLEEVSAEIDKKEDVVQEEVTETTTVVAGVAAAVASVGAIAATKDTEASKEVEEKLNILDGVEAIEIEEDYIKESEHKVEDLVDEFDSLNEEEVQQIMNPELAEEIISEEIVSEGEEKVVESSDLEAMITRAVSKAITKEMLQEALNDMEITVSLKMKKSDES